MATPNLMRRRGSLLLDIGLSPLVYYLLLALGVRTSPALVAATVAATCRVGYTLVRRGKLDGINALIGAAYLLTLVISLATSDPRLLLAKDPIVTTAVALVLLASCVRGKPAIWAISSRLRGHDEQQRAAADAVWRADADVRFGYRLTTAVWGVALLAEAVVRALLIVRLPISVMVGLSTPIELAFVGATLAWSLWYRRTSPRMRGLHALREPVGSAGPTGPMPAGVPANPD